MNSFIMILISLVLLVITALYSGAETGIYQISRVRLRLGIERRKILYLLLGRAMHDGQGLLLTTLIGTNITNYLVTSIVASLFLAGLEGGHRAELYTTLVTAPVLFIFSELIPKSVFFYRADVLMPYMAPMLYFSHRIFKYCGAIPLLNALSTLSARFTGSDVPAKQALTAAQRHHVRNILAESRDEGILSNVQANIVNRLVEISNTRVRAVMIPLRKVRAMDVRSDHAALLEELRENPYTRLPVYENRLANIIGFVDIYEALDSEVIFSDLTEYLQPIQRLEANTTVSDAITAMQNQRAAIMLITRTSSTGRDRPIGIVTMKDLVEEIVGELGEW